MTNQTMSDKGQSTVVLRAVTPRSLTAVVRECLERCDWRRVVPRGSTVVLKPNLCTAVPEKF
mgnify:CR=1 FL=1